MWFLTQKTARTRIFLFGGEHDCPKSDNVTVRDFRAAPKNAPFRSDEGGIGLSRSRPCVRLTTTGFLLRRNDKRLLLQNLEQTQPCSVAKSLQTLQGLA